MKNNLVAATFTPPRCICKRWPGHKAAKTPDVPK
jgi:hypothetical protein